MTRARKDIVGWVGEDRRMEAWFPAWGLGYCIIVCGGCVGGIERVGILGVWWGM